MTSRSASFLTKTLYVDWRVGARHFLELLVDDDIANNQLNWQWVAGTGTDTRPNRVLNPVLQGKRYDPEGTYVRRWVPELEGLGGAAVHEPWKLKGLERAAYDYPGPIVELADGLARIAQRTGRPLGTVESHARRGLYRLRRCVRTDSATPASSGPLTSTHKEEIRAECIYAASTAYRTVAVRPAETKESSHGQRLEHQR